MPWKRLYKKPEWDFDNKEAARQQQLHREQYLTQEERAEIEEKRQWLLSIIESNPYPFLVALGLVKDSEGYYHAP